MKCEGCVKIGKKHADRPLLHRKTGTIGIGNIHRRKLLSPPKGNLAIFKSSADLLNHMNSKHVHWASPIKTEHLFIATETSDAESIVEEDSQPQNVTKMATMDLKSALSLMIKATKSIKLTPYFCFVCKQYLSSQSKLKRHNGTQKHQLQVMRHASVDPLSQKESNHVESASPFKQEQAVPDVEKDTIEIVTKPMASSSFYCSDCHQQYSSRKHWIRHQKTKKHRDSVFVNQIRKGKNQQQA